MKYCPLNITSTYTFLSSSLKVDDIFKISTKNKYPYFAINDLNAMFSYSDIVKYMGSFETKPIFASSFIVSFENGRSLKISAYIVNDQGYSNLTQIISNNSNCNRELEEMHKLSVQIHN